MAKPRADRAGRDRGIVVVKISGSLVESARGRAILGIVGRARRPVVVMPGGDGALAEAVDRLHNVLDLSDTAAYRMAILAMHQTAMAMADLQPRLILVETISAMHQALAAGRVPVWLPLRLSDRDHSIPADGTMGADGLAARLGERLGAILVLLVKPRRVRRRVTAASLAADGTVDAAFAEIVERARLPYRLIGASETSTLAEIVAALSPRANGAHLCRAGSGRGRRMRRQAVRGAVPSKI